MEKRKTILSMLLFTKHFPIHCLILYFKQFCRRHYCSPFTDEHTEAQEYNPTLRANSPDVRASVSHAPHSSINVTQVAMSQPPACTQAFIHHEVRDFMVNMS